MRQVVGGRAKYHTAASTSQMSRFETQTLTRPLNLKALSGLPGVVGGSCPQTQADSQADPGPWTVRSARPTVSRKASSYNGHFGCTCYHPLFCFNQFGDLERALLRNGKVHSADDWRSVLEPVVARYRDAKVCRFFRGDAAFAKPEVYRYLEAEGYSYAIRLPANAILYRDIEYLLTRPVGPTAQKAHYLLPQRLLSGG